MRRVFMMLVIMTADILVRPMTSSRPKVWKQVFSLPWNKSQLIESEAASVCKNLGGTFGLPSDQTHRELLREALRDTNSAPVWLALKKTTHAGWTWVNGTAANPTAVRSGTNVERCGAISQQETSVVATDCIEDRNGFLCEIKGSSACTVEQFTQACVQIGPKTYIIGCETNSWYHARAICKEHGGDLAIVDKSDVLHKVFGYITDGKDTGVCSLLFIGLSYEDWKVQNPKGDVVPTFVNWTSNEPRHDSACSQIAQIHNRSTYSWKSSPCSTFAGVICQDYSKKTFKTMKHKKINQVQNTKSNNKPGAPTLVIAVVAVVCIFATAAGFVGVGVVLWKMRYKQRDGGRPESTRDLKLEDPGEQMQPFLLEDEELKDVPNVRPANIKLPEKIKEQIKNKIGIGIFSTNIDKVQVLTHASKLDPKINSYTITIFDYLLGDTKSKKEIDLKDTKSKRDIDLKSYVIVEMPIVLNRKDQIDEKGAKKLLEQLSVVFIPRIDRGKDKNILGLIHNLNKKSVVISAGDTNKNEFLAHETLCVGIFSLNGHTVTEKNGLFG